MNNQRLHSLDAVRAFALLLGVVFHATVSFVPGMPRGAWAWSDSSTSYALWVVFFTSHIFRMSLFFVVAGFFAHLVYHRRGARGFWADRLKRIGVPMVVGWVVLAPAVIAAFMWGIGLMFHGVAPQGIKPPTPPPGAFPLVHLWFLYYLLFFYVCTLLGRSIVIRLDRGQRARAWVDRCMRRVVESRFLGLLLGVPLALVLYSRAWVEGGGIPTPDKTLIPQLPAIAGFGTAIVFGWLLARQPELLGSWQRRWKFNLCLAIVATVVCMGIVGLPAAAPSPPSGAARVGFTLSYVTAIWSWVFAFVGIAMQFMSGESAVRRYLADASYWIYLTHLPIVLALQVALGQLPLHWSVKFPAILAVTFGVTLVSYHYLVRPTFIGELLNGRKHPRRRKSTEQADATPALTEPTDVVAELSGVEKRYGKTVALAGVDLTVRRGEILAVLGPNGAGKSTAISIWLGLTQADAGTARLRGRSPADVESRRGVGVMMQEVGLSPNLCVRELIDLTASYYPEPLSVDATLALTRTEPLARRRYGKLSAGQKRQAQFAIAVCGRPELLFLDEPTVGLDVQAREAMWRTIQDLRARGCSIVLTTHYLEEAEALADRVAVLAAGRLIASGSVDEVRSLVSRKQISCTSALSPDEVRGWPSVVAVELDARRMHITAIDAESVVRRLLGADSSLRDLEVRQAGLAEAFTELTKEAA
jgi:ABC-type multidrug transport system ATPase subunit/peptidoglycan/LPS O-acetylase OafA/YrhL